MLGGTPTGSVPVFPSRASRMGSWLVYPFFQAIHILVLPAGPKSHWKEIVFRACILSHFILNLFQEVTWKVVSLPELGSCGFLTPCMRENSSAHFRRVLEEENLSCSFKFIWVLPPVFNRVPLKLSNSSSLISPKSPVLLYLLRWQVQVRNLSSMCKYSNPLAHSRLERRAHNNEEALSRPWKR